MRRIITIFCFVFAISIVKAQIISQFSWDSNPVTAADVGPDAISVSSSATSSAGGVGGTNGLNAGLPKLDLNFIIADNAIFNVAGIDVSFDYQRDESAGTFFQRGSSLIINGTAQLSVSYRVDDGAGGFTTVSSGNVYAVPNDNTFRHYHFYYLPVTGYGALLVDGTEVWSNDGPDNRNMYWTGAGNITIGAAMDGSGSNQTFLDNLIIGGVTDSPLPVELTLFEVRELENHTVQVLWQTASEINNDYFTVERALDAKSWEAVLHVDGAGNSTEVLDYEAIDDHPYSGTSYYRLKQTDFNGEYSYSGIRAVNISLRGRQVVIYPNPAENMIMIEGDPQEFEQLGLFNVMGLQVDIPTKMVSDNENKLIMDLSDLKTGSYFIRTQNFVYQIFKR